MPNHVTTLIQIASFGGVPEEEIRKALLNDKNQVDFNLIVPMPECLMITDTSHPDPELKAAYKTNIREHGHKTWYGWRSENWGTKWNAYDQPDEGFPVGTTEFRFDTAWASPYELITILSEKLPGVTFMVSYADEDIGRNCGKYEITAGEITGLFTDKTPAECSAFAFGLKYPDADRREHGYDENWEYSDDVYDQWEKENEEA